MQSNDNEIVINDDDDSASDESMAKTHESVPEKKEKEEEEEDDEVIFVPRNPTTWSEKHIEMWIKWASNQFDIKPPLDASRFPKSGAELVKFSKAEFFIVCGSFSHGKMVVEHFRYLMENVEESVDETLLNDDEPGN
jgi:hypothetical protein